MSAVVADLDNSSTPQDTNTNTNAGAGEGGGVETNEGTPESNEQHGSNVVDVAGTSAGGVPVLSPKPVYGKGGVVAEVADDIAAAVDAFTVPTGFVRKGSRVDSFMYSLGVYVEQSAGAKHKYYCLASAECRRGRKEIPCPRGDRSNVNTHLKRKHGMQGTEGAKKDATRKEGQRTIRSALAASANSSLGKNRTTSLLRTIAICMAISGVSLPPLSAAPAAWLDYLKSALYTDRFVDHFEGFPSALAIMATIALVSILAYPLRVVLNGDDARAAVAPPGPSLVACVASFGIPLAIVWSITAWAVSRFAWGLASGLWVGLFATCTTLKIISFATIASSTPEKRASGGAADTKSQVEERFPLTFRDYIFFLFLAPSLVCDVRLMQASARRPSHSLRAASEFFHAALTCLAVHCAVGSVVAPAMRMLVLGIRPRWFEHAGPEWAKLDAAGGGGWPSWALTNELLEGNKGPWVTAVCFVWLLMPLTSGACFLMSYAFWHCVCLGMAELWGFPDRDLYGCWWLVLDDPRKAFQMWSAPVHRWLAACVHKPMLQATIARHNAMVGSNKSGKQPSPESKKKSAGSNHVVHKASTAGWVLSVLVTFLVSIVFHEAIALVAFRGAFVPINTFLLTVTAALFLSWGTIFPVSGKRHRRESSSAAGVTTTTAVVTAGDGSCIGGNKTNIAINASGDADDETTATPFGTQTADSGEYAAKLFVFNFSVQLSFLIAECAGWLLWRETLKK